MSHYLFLVAASILFVGSHFLMSHPWRADMVRRFGANGFLGLYSLVSFATFGWMLLEFGRAPKGDALWPASDAVWIVASVLTLVAAVLFSGSFIPVESILLDDFACGVREQITHGEAIGNAIPDIRRRNIHISRDHWVSAFVGKPAPSQDHEAHQPPQNINVLPSSQIRHIVLADEIIKCQKKMLLLCVDY